MPFDVSQKHSTQIECYRRLFYLTQKLLMENWKIGIKKLASENIEAVLLFRWFPLSHSKNQRKKNIFLKNIVKELTNVSDQHHLDSCANKNRQAWFLISIKFYQMSNVEPFSQYH